MKKRLLSVLIIGILALSMVPGISFSQDPLVSLEAFGNPISQKSEVRGEDVLGIDAGALPGSALYGVKRFGESLDLFFTFDDARKANKKYEFAEKRLIEAEKMADKDNYELALKTLRDYSKDIDEAGKEHEKFFQEPVGKELAGRADERIYRHVLVLEKIHSEVPENEKLEVRDILEASVDSHGRMAEKDIERENAAKNPVTIAIALDDQSVMHEVPLRFAQNFLEGKRDFKGKFKEIEIENEAEIKDMIAQKMEIRSDRALMELEDARGRIAEAENHLKSEEERKLDNSRQPRLRDEDRNTTKNLLENAREHLGRAEDAFMKSKFGEAFGQAVAAERLAMAAGRIADGKITVEEDRTRVRAEIIGNRTDARVEVRFVSANTNKTAIAEEILDKLKLNRSEIASLIRIQEEDNFLALMSGSEEVPPVNTTATGRADFDLRRDGTELGFVVRVENIENATASHIHLAPRGQNGPVAAFLFSGPKKRGVFAGVLSEGVIKAENLTGSLANQSLSNLTAKMRVGEAYVNVHTDKNPAGEIRGQIMPEQIDIRERLQAEAKAEKGVTEAEAELRFPLDTTNREAIIDGIAAKLAALTVSDILNALEFEAEDIRDRNRGRGEIELEGQETEVRAEIISNAAEAKVEVKFTSQSTDKNAIAEEILKKLKLSSQDVTNLLRIRTKDDDRIRERLEAEAETEGNVTRAKAELRFRVNGTSREGIIAAINSRLAALTLDDILNALELDREDIRQEDRREDRREDRGRENEIEDARGQEPEPERGGATETGDDRGGGSSSGSGGSGRGSTDD